MLEKLESNLDRELFLPKISAIVPIYNGEKDLPDLLECLKQQTYPSQQVEFFLIDNHSSDRTKNILEIELRSSKHTNFNLHYLSEDKIQSSYAARNRGIKMAHHDILVFTDADCRPQPQWLEELVQPFRNSQIGIVVGELIALSGNSILEKYAEYCGVMSPKFLLEHPFCAYGQTANLAIRKQAFQEVGLFRPYLTTGGDADICWRILKSTNWQLEFAPKAIVSHRHRSTFKELKSQWHRYGTSNRYLHELYDVNLMRELSDRELFYRLTRWLIKELPMNTIKFLTGKINAIELIKTPIDLITTQARTTGQRTSQLPELAKQIEWLDN